VDFVTDLPPSQGNTTVLIIVDRFSKACRILPLPVLPSAMQTMEALFAHIFWHYRIPENIVSYRCPQFTSRIWKAFMERLAVTVNLTSGYRPQTNGQVEWVNQKVGMFLGCYFQARHGKWVDFLPWAEYVLNSLRYSSTNLTPFQ
jgi:transposase InsO family protein